MFSCVKGRHQKKTPKLSYLGLFCPNENTKFLVVMTEFLVADKKAGKRLIDIPGCTAGDVPQVLHCFFIFC